MSDLVLSPKLSFLINACLNSQGDKLLIPVSEKILDWEKLQELSKWHQVTAMLYNNLESNGNK